VSGGEQFVHPRAEPAQVSTVMWVGSGRVVTGGVGYLRAAVALALVRNPTEFALPERGIEVPPKQVKTMFRALDDVVGRPGIVCCRRNIVLDTFRLRPWAPEGRKK
jgi:hypothetical protein